MTCKDALLEVKLTERELEAAGWTLKGLSVPETGKMMFITEKGVKFHLTNVYRKTACKNRFQLALKYGRLEPMKMELKHQNITTPVEIPESERLPMGRAL